MQKIIQRGEGGMTFSHKKKSIPFHIQNKTQCLLPCFNFNIFLFNVGLIAVQVLYSNIF